MCILAVSIPPDGFMSFSVWQLALSELIVAVRSKEGVFGWSLPQLCDAALVASRADDVGVPLFTCAKHADWPTPILPDTSDGSGNNFFRTMALSDERLLLGDCMGIVSSVPLDFCTQGGDEVVPWGDVPVVQLNNAKGLTSKYGAYIKGLGADVVGVQRVTAALEYEGAIVFIHINDDDKTALVCNQAGVLAELRLLSAEEGKRRGRKEGRDRKRKEKEADVRR